MKQPLVRHDQESGTVTIFDEQGTAFVSCHESEVCTLRDWEKVLRMPSHSTGRPYLRAADAIRKVLDAR